MLVSPGFGRLEVRDGSEAQAGSGAPTLLWAAGVPVWQSAPVGWVERWVGLARDESHLVQDESRWGV